MSELHINIVSFHVPYPPDYGGVMDVFYKLKSLHEAGIKVHLHCFRNKKNTSDQLEKLCETVTYYHRSAMWKGFFTNKPFIVYSRSAEKLKQNLLKNDQPVLFEGLHCCFFLDDPIFRERIKIVRMHNDEAAYYLSLAQHEKSFLKKLYFYEEYRRLFRYENILQHANYIMCISQQEEITYQNKYKNVSYLAPFHGNTAVSSETGKGEYAIYHGNLSVNENEQAVLYLLTKVFNDLPFSLHVYGKKPTAYLKELFKKYPRHILKEDPEADELNEAMRKAHVHILPAFTETGIKLKLVQALYKGRFCLVNHAMVQGTGLEKYCIIKAEEAEMKISLTELFTKSFTAEDILFRKNIENEFSDSLEVQKIIKLLQKPLPS